MADWKRFVRPEYSEDPDALRELHTALERRGYRRLSGEKVLYRVVGLSDRAWTPASEPPVGGWIGSSFVLDAWDVQVAMACFFTSTGAGIVRAEAPATGGIRSLELQVVHALRKRVVDVSALSETMLAQCRKAVEQHSVFTHMVRMPDGSTGFVTGFRWDYGALALGAAPTSALGDSFARNWCREALEILGRVSS